MPFKGVYHEGSAWLARIYVDGKQRRIGRFATEEDAARAYDREALRLHGEDAVLNFPGENMPNDRKIASEWAAAPQNWQSLRHHPLACLVEFGAGINLDQMAVHMRENGFDDSDPIMLVREGKELLILDGRHKQSCAIQAGVTPTFRLFTGQSPKAYVEKKAHRQHLNESQRALLFVKLGKLSTSDVPSVANLQHKPPTQSQIADAANTSKRTVSDATKVDRKGTPELNQAVADGTLRVSDAAQVAEEPPAVQNQAVNEARNGKAKTARAAAVKNPSANGHPKPEAEEEVTDAEGMPVPPQAAAAFKDVEELNSICHALDAAVARIKQAGKGAAARLINVESITQSIQSARKTLWQSRPTHVCPYCAGKDKKCNCCKGEGWTNTATYKQSPAGAQQ